MKHLKSRTIIIILFIFTTTVTAQDNSLKHDDILKIDVYLVERSQVCLDGTDYPNCKSIGIEDLDDILFGKLSYSIKIPPDEVYISDEKYKSLFYDITRFRKEYHEKDFQLDYSKSKSILLIIRNESLSDEMISIERSKCRTLSNEPIDKYAFSPDFKLRYKERWFNHQNALFFHPAYKCEFEIKAKSQKRSWVLHFMK